MSNLKDLMPADLRARLEQAPVRRSIQSSYVIDDWQAERRNAAAVAGNREAAEVEAEIRRWRAHVLESGAVIARGWPAGKAGSGPRQAIAPEAWAALRYLPAKNCAVSKASGAVMFEGLDFEAAAPKRGPGRPKVHDEAAGDDEALRILMRDGGRMCRKEFRQRAKAAMPGAKGTAVDAAWKQAREKRRENPGEKRRISISRQRV